MNRWVKASEAALRAASSHGIGRAEVVRMGSRRARSTPREATRARPDDAVRTGECGRRNEKNRLGVYPGRPLVTAPRHLAWDDTRTARGRPPPGSCSVRSPLRGDRTRQTYPGRRACGSHTGDPKDRCRGDRQSFRGCSSAAMRSRRLPRHMRTIDGSHPSA
jgi:hypothetical protein